MVPSTLTFPFSVSIFFFLVFFTSLFFVPPVSFQTSSSYTKAQQEADECYSAEYTPYKCFTFRMNMSGDRKETAGYEWTGCATSGRECLCEAVELTQNIVVWGRVGDLFELEFPRLMKPEATEIRVVPIREPKSDLPQPLQS